MLEYKPQEELIALIKRQEKELANERAEVARLRETLAGVQSRMGGVLVEKAASSVFCPECHSRESMGEADAALCKLHDVVKYTRLARSIQNPAGNHPSGPWEDFYACDDVVRALEAAPCKPAELLGLPPFAAYIYTGSNGVQREAIWRDEADAYTASAVAAAVAPLKRTNLELTRVNAEQRLQIGRLDTALERAQPVAGELPPLPAPASTWPGFPYPGTEYFTKPQMIKAMRDVQFSQPVQQPAAVVGRQILPEGHKQKAVNFGKPILPGMLVTIERVGKYRLFTLHAAPAPAADVQADAFPKRDHSKPAEQQGMFRKFDVRRVDGSDVPGGKHHGCRYFVLDMDHDQHAAPALAAYAVSYSVTHPALSAELASEFGQPDSGRDAALKVALDALDRSEPMYSRKFSQQERKTQHIAAIAQVRAALAAHPAPSSDAAQCTHTCLAGTVDGIGCPHDSCDIEDGVRAAHPANGAQAGLSDEEISDIWRKLCAGGKSFGKGVGVNHIARAVLAAAKKGG